MDVKIFQTPNLGFLIAEVVDVESTSTNDDWYVQNPRYLQAYAAPDAQGVTQLNIQLSPVVYQELLKDGATYETTLPSSYKDVTHLFNDHPIDMYVGVEARVKDANTQKPVEDDCCQEGGCCEAGDKIVSLHD